MEKLRTMLSGQSKPMAALLFLGFLNAACILFMNNGYAGMLNAALAREPSGIAGTALMLALAAVANGAIVVAQYALYGRISENAAHRLRALTTRRMLGAECAALHARLAGDSMTRVSSDLKQSADWLRNQLCPAVVEAVVLACAMAAMAIVNWKLTLAAFSVVPLITWFAVKASRPIRQAAGKQQAALARSNALVKSVLDAFPLMKIFEMKAMLCRKYGEAVDESVMLAVKANKVERTLMSINGFSSLIPMGILLGAGGAAVIGGGMTAGALLVYLNLSNYIVGPLMNLPSRIAAARAFSANLERVTELGSDPLEEHRPVNLRLADRESDNAVEFAGVSFGYDEGAPVLRGVSLEAPRGSRIALVGPSGCGKSTVIKLIAALYMPTQGCVFVNGRDTRKWDLAGLRDQLAVVMQDPFLFPGSLLENVTCGRDMPIGKVREVCRAAGLEELIESLPGGLGADVGERGAKLSGGQKQRVAIARAIAKDAPILLLDEATSALDAKTERDVQEALETLMRGRTALIVTHRLSAIRDADRIACMDGGRIAEWGTHEELMALDGYYAGLVRVQGEPSAAGKRGECA